MTIRPLILLLAAGCGLAACDSKPAPAEDGDGRSAKGRVLGGTISDSMLPLDSVTSQSPRMKQRPASDDATGGEDAANGASAETGEEAATEPAEPAEPEVAPTAAPAEPTAN